MLLAINQINGIGVGNNVAGYQRREGKHTWRLAPAYERI